MRQIFEVRQIMGCDDYLIISTTTCHVEQKTTVSYQSLVTILEYHCTKNENVRMLVRNCDRRLDEV